MELPRLTRSLAARIPSPLLVLAAAMASLWLVHLQRSFWLDELQTAWVVNGTFAEAAARAFHTQGFTPLYYLLLWGMRPLVGFSEFGLRLPSILLTMAAAVLLLRIARAFSLSRRDAAVAALFFVCFDSTIETAVTARPYALALFAALLSFYSFERWMRSGKLLFKLSAILSTLLTIYAHFLFSGIVILEILYWCMFRRQSKVSALQLGSAGIYIVIGLIPCIPQVGSMLDKRDLMAIAQMPGIFDLGLAVLPWITCISAAIAYFAAAACGARSSAENSGCQAIPREVWIFVVTWAILPGLLIFAASYLLGTSMFVARYFEWASPGAALLGALLYSRITSERTRVLFPVFFLLFCVAAECTKDREPEDWRSAVAGLHRQHEQHAGTVLYYSGVIESSNSGWLNDPMKQGQFLSPILYYQTPQPVLLLPFEFASAEAAAYWSRSVVPRLPEQGRLYVLLLDNLSWTAEDGSRVSIRGEIKKLLEKEGFTVSSETPYKRVWIISLDKVAPITTQA